MRDLAAALAARLQVCVDWAGGKRPLAKLTGISEAQIYRYLNSASSIPADKLAVIAETCGMDAGWLLTGTPRPRQEEGQHPPFLPELMIDVIRTFDELLVESDKRFTPQQRARAVTLIYESLRHEEQDNKLPAEIDMRLAPFYPDFLSSLRAGNRMDDYLHILERLEYQKTLLNTQTLQQFDGLVRASMVGAYEGAAAEMYFDKLGNNLLPQASKMLLTLVDGFVEQVGRRDLSWLDVGCGNGRHLAFLSRQYPYLRLRGVEASSLALEICRQQTKAGKLPIGIVEEGDFRSLPVKDASVDVVYCRLGLYCLPYMPGANVGARLMFAEVARVLKPGGRAWFLTYEGTRRDYVPFVQYHTAESIAALAADAGLEVRDIRNQQPVNETGGVAGQDYSRKLDRGLAVTLAKP